MSGRVHIICHHDVFTLPLACQDYTSYTLPYKFKTGAPPNSSLCLFDVGIIDDNQLEGREDFIVHLSSPDPYVTIHIKELVVFIEDNDRSKSVL